MDDSTNYDTEKRIVTSFVLDTAFCHKMFPSLDYDLFSNEYSKKIVKWCEVYFNNYGRAPKNEMEAIFHRNKKALNDDAQEIIGSVLEHLSDLHDQGLKFDEDHSVDLAKEFFSERSLRLTAEKVLHHLDRGEGQIALESYQLHKTPVEMERGVNNAFTDRDLTDKTIEKMWYPEESKDTMLQLLGRIGDYMGPLEVGWLVAFMAPMKRGKTFCLTNCTFDAILQKKRVCFVSLEMPDKDMNRRSAMSVTGMKRGSGPTKIVPIFDCLKNQKGTCNLYQRPRKNEAIGDVTGPDDLKLHPKYKSCTACRNDGTKNFSPAVWYREAPDDSSPGNAKKLMRAWEDTFDQYLRTTSFPADTATVKTLEAHMDYLIKTQGFDTQILVVDYADLLLAADRRLEYRHRLDDIWKSLKSLAHKRGILIITASQTNRTGMGAEEVDSSHAAEDIRKVAIVDMFLALNQTKDEKRKGFMRLGFTDSRHTSHLDQCFILQDLSRGQFCLDSEFL